MRLFVTYKRHIMRCALSLMVIGGYWWLLVFGTDGVLGSRRLTQSIFACHTWTLPVAIASWKVFPMPDMDASSCCRKLEGLPGALHGRFQLLSQAGRSPRGVYRQTDAQGEACISNFRLPACHWRSSITLQTGKIFKVFPSTCTSSEAFSV